MNCVATLQLSLIPLCCIREARKPVLADDILDLIGSDAEANIIPNGTQYVLDCGALVQRIPWVKGCTYCDICNQYTAYATKKNGEVIIVFDGYETANTKDNTHQ